MNAAERRHLYRQAAVTARRRNGRFRWGDLVAVVVFIVIVTGTAGIVAAVAFGAVFGSSLALIRNPWAVRKRRPVHPRQSDRIR